MKPNFSLKEFLIQVDKNDQPIGKIEKLKAHKKGILHRGFTVCLFYQGKAILQLRKHQIFDQYLDLTCSSHPIFLNERPQPIIEAVYQTLKREWMLEKKDLISPLLEKGKIIYRAKDKKSGFVENEVCSLFVGQLKKIPSFNPQFAYGFFLVEKNQLISKKLAINQLFAPWAKKLLKLL